MLRQWWKRHTYDADEGAATAEFAVVLACVAAVAILVLCLGRACVVSMNFQDAAAAGARALAVDDKG
ncbi:pilus assembly protein, partial [Bifidobacterium pseudocatenulatum]|nr:pilus assembly protein [Bifidobacterium pseudocatenulatum]